MPPAWGLLLTTCLLMAAPAREEDPAARAQATLQRVAKLPVEHQRAWLRLIEQRYGWAVLLTLKPADAQREQDRVAKVLRQKIVAWNELLGLLRQLDQREKAAIARLVRQYRSEAYETFHKRPRDLVDREDAWYRIWSLWEKAGSPPEQQDRLLNWLADAIKASSKDSIGPLPPDAKFGDDVPLVPEQLVKQLTPPPAARPLETARAAPRQPANKVLPGPEPPARSPLAMRVPDPRREFGPVKLPPAAVALWRAESIVSSPVLAAPPAVVPPWHFLPPIAADDPGQLTLPPAPPHPALVLVLRTAPTAAENSAEGLARTGLGDAKPPPIGPGPPSRPAARADQHAEVNVEELGTRIEGINLSLRNLEAELHEQRDFTADQLDSLLSRLDILVLRQKDLALFRDLISPRERAKVGQIDSSRVLVATMGNCIAELRTRTRQNGAASEAQRSAALKQLDELSDRLATITEK